MSDALTRLAASHLDPAAQPAVTVSIDGGTVLVAQRDGAGVELLRWAGTPAEWDAALLAARDGREG